MKKIFCAIVVMCAAMIRADGQPSPVYGINPGGPTNTAVGVGALSGSNPGNQYNTAFGNGTLNNTSAGYNTAIGGLACGNLTSGTGGNVCVGLQAGQHMTTGAGNVFIGDSVGSSTITTGTNNIIIGTTSSCDTAAGATSNTIGVCAGSTAIWSATGTGTPSTATNTFSGAMQMPNLASSSAATTGTVCWTTGTGNFTVDTTLACLSSTARIKQNIHPLNDGLNEVMALRPVSYDLKPEYNPKGLGPMVGLIAEDVQKTDARLVGLDANGDVQGVRYMQLTAVLIKAIQEQQREINTLKRQLKNR